MQITVYFTNRAAQRFDVNNVVFRDVSGGWFTLTASRSVTTTRQVTIVNPDETTETREEPRTSFPELIGGGKVIINWEEVAYVQEYIAPEGEDDDSTSTENEGMGV